MLSKIRNIPEEQVRKWFLICTLSVAVVLLSVQAYDNFEHYHRPDREASASDRGAGNVR